MNEMNQMNELHEYTFVLTAPNGIGHLKCEYCTESEAKEKALQLLKYESMVWYDTPAHYKSINAFMQAVANHLHIGFEFVDTFLERVNA